MQSVSFHIPTQRLFHGLAVALLAACGNIEAGRTAPTAPAKPAATPSVPAGVPVNILPPTPIPAPAETLKRLSAAAAFVALEPQRSVSVLHELAVAGMRFESLEDFLLSPASTHRQELAGLAHSRERGADGGEILAVRLSRPMTIAFSRISSAMPIAVYTNGHALRLVAHDLSRLSVDGRAPGKAGGSVDIVTTGQDLPKLQLSGANGRDGRDAQCPAGLPGDCLSEEPARRPRKPAREQVPVQGYAKGVSVLELNPEKDSDRAHMLIAFKLEEHLLAPAEDSVYEGKIFASCSFKTKTVPPTPLGSVRCRPLPPRREGLIGRFSYEEHTLEPSRNADAIRGHDGEALPGEAGEPGFPGGSVRLTGMQTLTAFLQAETSGGSAGMRGRNGYVEPGAGAPALSAKVAEHLIKPVGKALRVRWTKRFEAFRNDLILSFDGPSKIGPVDEAQAFSLPEEPLDLPARFDGNEMRIHSEWHPVRILPAGDAGRPAAILPRERAAAGKPGSVQESARPESVDAWLQQLHAVDTAAAKQEFPLPAAMAQALVRAFQEGRVKP